MSSMIIVAVALNEDAGAARHRHLRTRDELLKLITKVANGSISGRVLAGVEEIAGVTAAKDIFASATATIAATIVDGDTLVVNGVTYTWRTAPDASNEMGIGATDEESIDNAVRAINHHTAGGLVFASKLSDTALKLEYIGLPDVGDGIGISQTGAWATLSASTLSRTGSSARAAGPAINIGS